jgi:flavin reductase (DIM6/NTAB) family NADH-FMN oxidoreductase RutF
MALTTDQALKRNLVIYRLFTVISFTPFFLPVCVLFWQETA